MKEVFNVNKIIQELETKGYFVAEAICDECALRLISIVFDNFTSANFNMTQVEDCIYRLIITL